MAFPARECFLVSKSDWYCQRESKKKILADGSVLEFHEEGIFCLFQNVKLVTNDLKGPSHQIKFA
jgi:hypothetical protein